MILLNNLNLNRRLPEKEKKIIHSIGNNLLSLIDKAVQNKGNTKITNIIDIYTKNIEECKYDLDKFKVDNKILIEELKVLKNKENELKSLTNKISELQEINKEILKKIDELHIKLKEYASKIKTLYKINKELTLVNKQLEDKIKTKNNKYIDFLFAAYYKNCNDFKKLIIDISQQVINIKLEINKCIKIANDNNNTIKINNTLLEARHNKYIIHLENSNFKTFVKNEIDTIMNEIDNYRKICEDYDISEINAYLIDYTNKLQLTYNTINDIYIFYNNQINSQVHNIADTILKL